MKKLEKTKELEIQALKIIQRLTEKGYTAYYAGGYVRDKILGIESADIDIVSSAPIETVQKVFQRTIPIGAHYGVILVCMGRKSFEVSRFRKDGPYLDGRHPSFVEFCSLEEDSLRRDFTINGMIYDPLKKETLDYVGGREDLEKGLIRAIGNPLERIQEDKLRMLRAIRFACRFSYQIEAKTWQAIQEQHKTILEVSTERIRDELSKILSERQPRRGIELLEQSGLLGMILPELLSLQSTQANGNNLYQLTLAMLEKMREQMPENIHKHSQKKWEEQKYKKELVWACLFSYLPHPPPEENQSQKAEVILNDNNIQKTTLQATDKTIYPTTDTRTTVRKEENQSQKAEVILNDNNTQKTTLQATDKTIYPTTDTRTTVRKKKQKNPIQSILQRFKLSNKEQSEILELTESLSIIERIQNESESNLKRFFRKKSFLNVLELYRCQCLVQNKSLKLYQFYQEKYDQWHTNLNPQPWLTGKDLIQKGFKPGPQFQVLLEYLEDAQLENKITTKVEALQYLESFDKKKYV